MLEGIEGNRKDPFGFKCHGAHCLRPHIEFVLIWGVKPVDPT